jgi:cobalt/nickel transport system permease protein
MLDWFFSEENIKVYNTCSFKKRKNILEKTLIILKNFFKETIFPKHTQKNGFLQKINSKIKVLTFISLIFILSFINKTEVFLIFLILAIILSVLSKINLFFFLKRTFIFVPLFTAIIIFPNIFNVFF